MPLPDLDRALLCTYTIEDYRRFMTSKEEHYSLLDEISKHFSEISLSQEIPGSALYPPLKVVDITPATVCTLNDSATLIIIPPEAFSTLKTKAWRFTNNEEEETLKPFGGAIHALNNDAADFLLSDTSPQKCRVFQSTIRVEISTKCSGSFALGNRLLFDQLFLQNDNVIYIECDMHKSGCSVRLTDDKEQAGILFSFLTPHLIVSETVFQNIRQIAAYRSVFRPEVSISFQSSFFEIPLDWFTVLEDMRGECICSSQLPTAASVAVAPLFEDFVLKSLYGDGYLSLVTRYLQTAGSQFLDHLIISEGDVLALPFSPLSEGQTNNISLSDVQAVNTELRTIMYKIRHWDGIRESEQDLRCLSFLLIRVAKILPESEMGFAVFASSGKKSSAMNLAPQSLFISPTYLAPVFTPQKSFFCDVEFKKKVRKCFETCLYSNKCRKVSFFVAQGLPENFCCEIIEDTAKEYGLSTCILTLEGLQQNDLVNFLNELKKDIKVPLVVLIRGSGSAEMETDIIFPFLDFFSQEENVPCPPITIFYVSESIEAIAPALTARSFNCEGTIMCASSTEENRKIILDYAFKTMCRTFCVLPSITLSLDNLASWTTGLSVADLIAFTADCVNNAFSAYNLPPHSKPVLSESRCEQVLQQYLNAHGYNLVSTKLQPVRWSDVGGLYEAKKELQEAIQLPLSHPELFTNGMKRRSGILFYGPPGCGKTLLAKAVATEMNMNFISVKGPELINQYVGESERNIRLLFQRARDSSPCIVFFDELDALAPARGSKGDGGGAMDRVVSQLLVEVDGVGQKKSDGTEGDQIIIIGATNRPDLLDPSLLRPGRFDRLCYLGIPSTKEEQLFAVRALTRKFTLDTNVSLEAVIEALECIYTGADFFALCSDAMMFAVQENIAKLTSQITLGVEKESAATVNLIQEETEVIPVMKVKMNHFLEARNNLKPSVTKEDLTRYEALKKKFST